jgi:predicted nucleic acid-binding Zn ribbon protein
MNRHKQQPFTPIADILKNQLAKMGGPKVTELTTLQVAWTKIVAPQIGSHTKIKQYKDHVLTVTADHPAFLSELHLMKGQLLSALRKQCPKIAVMDLHFRLENNPL